MKRALVIVGVTALLTLGPSKAHGQMESFVQAVRELADAAGHAEPARSSDIRRAANRMATALAEWDRRIRALEAQVNRDIPAAPAQRAYFMHVELGVTYRARGRLADALRELDAAVALQPSGSDVRVLQALTLEAAGRPD